MVDIEALKPEIIERLMPLNPDKIILFGSYAYGTPNEDSDIDLFIVKSIDKTEVRAESLKAHINIRDLIFKNKIGFDIFVDNAERMHYRAQTLHDYFYKDILEKGVVLYGK